jgi:hypothetical protein
VDRVHGVVDWRRARVHGGPRRHEQGGAAALRSPDAHRRWLERKRVMRRGLWGAHRSTADGIEAVRWRQRATGA